ncbi:hypothetical protein N7495_007712 [Penicillium taxi]|uniref:uncharacterized protein n=1 Tax=Penicillium taxi TaxID=168475 RepID=UPI002545293B|nr:uncharacterized protein N7495_007712 [Penicillium taxi]KAJ5887671.1 hypothetical protein N7495_007712 [Penicillium taxi]
MSPGLPAESHSHVERRKRGPELDSTTRSQICELHRTNKWGATLIQKHRFPNIPVSTINYTLTQERRRQKNQSSLPRLGQPRKLSEDDRDHIYELIQENPSVTTEELLAAVDHKINRQSLWRLMNELGLSKWRRTQRLALTNASPKSKSPTNPTT